MSRKEQVAREREAHAQGNPDVSIDKQKKIQEEREVAQQEAEKVHTTCHCFLIFFLFLKFCFLELSVSFVLRALWSFWPRSIKKNTIA